MENQITEIYPNKKGTVLMVYILYLLGFIFGGITTIVGLIIAYYSKSEATPLEKNHFEYQIKVFLWGLLWFVIGTITTYILIGFVILFGWVIWTLYKIIVGMIALSEGRLIK